MTSIQAYKAESVPDRLQWERRHHNENVVERRLDCLSRSLLFLCFALTFELSAPSRADAPSEVLQCFARATVTLRTSSGNHGLPIEEMLEINLGKINGTGSSADAG